MSALAEEPAPAPTVTVTQQAAPAPAVTVEKTVEVEALEEESDPASSIPGDGTYIVGEDVKPGTYTSNGGGTCYWARLDDLDGGLDSIAENNIGDGQAVARISEDDAAFETTGCGTWERQ